MSRAVLLTKQVPWPSDSGGRIREKHVTEVFRRHFDEVHVLAFGAAPDPSVLPPGVRVHPYDRPSVLPGALRSRSAAVGRWFSPAMARTVADLLVPGSHLHVGFPHMVVNAPRPGRVDSLDFHNVESHLFAQRGRRHPRAVLRPALALEARRLAAWERRAGQVALVSCVSEQDRLRLHGMGVEALVAANGTELPDHPAPLPDAEQLVFVGTLDWGPNVEGALWFAGEVWPQLVGLRPAATVTLVGRAPAPELTALSVPGLSVAGDVPAVDPWYARSRLAICPLLTGGGSRLKIIEALGHGRPVVSTTLGAEGLESLIGQGVVIADSPSDFAARTADLLADPAACAALGERGRAAVAATWSWQATLAPLDAALART